MTSAMRGFSEFKMMLKGRGGGCFENIDVPFLVFSFFYIQEIKIECQLKRSFSAALLPRDNSKYDLMIISKYFTCYKTTHSRRLMTRDI